MFAAGGKVAFVHVVVETHVAAAKSAGEGVETVVVVVVVVGEAAGWLLAVGVAQEMAKFVAEMSVSVMGSVAHLFESSCEH